MRPVRRATATEPARFEVSRRSATWVMCAFTVSSESEGGRDLAVRRPVGDELDYIRLTRRQREWLAGRDALDRFRRLWPGESLCLENRAPNGIAPEQQSTSIRRHGGDEFVCAMPHSATVTAVAVAANDLTGVSPVVTGTSTGISTATRNPTISVLVPANMAPGVYVATITHSVA